MNVVLSCAVGIFVGFVAFGLYQRLNIRAVSFLMRPEGEQRIALVRMLATVIILGTGATIVCMILF